MEVSNCARRLGEGQYHIASPRTSNLASEVPCTSATEMMLRVMKR
jgi:hypothetical protein